MIEESFGVSKTVAWRILRKCGARPGPGHALVCHRLELIERLQELKKDGAVHEREIARLDRLDRLLQTLRPSVVANMTPVAKGEDALRILSSTFRKLPPNVRLTPRSLQIDFKGPEEFLSAMGAVIFALHNDYEEIRSFIEQAG